MGRRSEALRAKISGNGRRGAIRFAILTAALVLLVTKRLLMGPPGWVGDGDGMAGGDHVLAFDDVEPAEETERRTAMGACGAATVGNRLDAAVDGRCEQELEAT